MRYFFGYGIILQVLALVHFVRRRPDTFWLWIILFGGGLGSLVYLVVEAVPDLRLLRGSIKVLEGRKRRRELEWLVSENPAPANYEELGALYLQEKRFADGRVCFTKALNARSDSLDPFYRRALCSIGLRDYAAALADLEHVVRKQPNYDFYHAALLLAEAYAETGQRDQAAALFEEVTHRSTATDAQLSYALFLAAESRPAEAREWAQRILAKRNTMPRFQKRRERPLFRRAAALLKELPQPAPAATTGVAGRQSP